MKVTLLPRLPIPGAIGLVEGDDAPKHDPPNKEMLSDDQRVAYDTIFGWFETALGRGFASTHLTLGGLAGTGKTTLVAAIAHELDQRGIRVVFAAYTGKAVDVLQRKLASYGIGLPCTTLHSLMYMPEEDEHGVVREWVKKAEIDASLVVVDEASMISAELWKDLRSYCLPILAVGDHGQLPPVGAGTLSLLDQPDIKLEKIHRQAEGNPILALAHHVRRGGEIDSYRGEFVTADGLSGIFHAPLDTAIEHIAWDFDAAGICYFNSTRNRLNEIARRRRGFVGPEIVICLRNEHEIGIFNGMRGLCLSIGVADDKYRAEAEMYFPDHGIRVTAQIQLQQFGRRKIESLETYAWARGWRDLGLLFDYGYVLTCHKSQGSQWRTVVLQPEVGYHDTSETRARWLYTAVTRASERLVIV